MNTFPSNPSPLNPCAQDLADRVGLRLFELHRFDTSSGAADNAARFVRPGKTRNLRGGYARPAPLPTRFSVHH